LVLGLVFLALGLILSKLNYANRETLSPLECGFTTVRDSRQPVSLRFFVFAVVFVIFDIELILVVPVITNPLETLGSLWFFFFFVNLLSVGLIFEWTNKAFEWLKFKRSS